MFYVFLAMGVHFEFSHPRKFCYDFFLGCPGILGIVLENLRSMAFWLGGLSICYIEQKKYISFSSLRQTPGALLKSVAGVMFR